MIRYIYVCVAMLMPNILYAFGQKLLFENLFFIY